jgi:hypothetical protein
VLLLLLLPRDLELLNVRTGVGWHSYRRPPPSVCPLALPPSSSLFICKRATPVCWSSLATQRPYAASSLCSRPSSSLVIRMRTAYTTSIHYRCTSSRSVLHSPVRTAVRTGRTAKIWSSPAVWTDCVKVVRPVHDFRGLGVDCSRLQSTAV